LQFTTAQPGPVRITIFDLSGRRRVTVTDEVQSSAGIHEYHLAALARLRAGIYLYRIEAAQGRAEGRLVLLK